MKNILYTITLSFLLVTTAQSKDLEIRNGIVYKAGTEQTFTGKSTTYFENGQKKQESNFKNGKPDGLVIDWYESGKKKQEMNIILTF